MLIITIPLGGISGGTQSILAYNYGAGNSRRILEAQKTIIALCAGFTTLMFLVSNAAGTLFAQLFTSDPQIVSMVVRAIHISTLSVIPLGIQYEIVDGFTAMVRALFVCTLLLPEIRLLYRSVSSAAVLCTGKHLLRGTYFRPDRAGCLNDCLLDFDSEDSETAGRGGTADAHKKA